MLIVGVVKLVAPPGFQVYVIAPIAPKVVVLPAHIVLAAAATVNVGFELTVNDKVVVFVQPNVEVPVTV